MEAVRHEAMNPTRPGWRRLFLLFAIALAVLVIAIPLIRGTEVSPNMLVAMGALAGLGSLFVAVSLVGYMLEARDLASLEGLFEETRRNLAEARRVADRVGLEFDRDSRETPPEAGLEH